MFINVDPDKEDLDTLKAINEIFKYIKQLSNQLTKTSLIDKKCQLNY